MKQNVIEELQTLENMVLNWKRDYLSMLTPEGGDEFLADDLREEVSRHVVPFVGRLQENGHLSFKEAYDFVEACYSHVEELRTSLIKGNEGQE